MKKICMFLIVLVMSMGYAPSAQTNAQEEGNARENVIIHYLSDDVIECTIDQIHYQVWTENKYHHATVVAVGSEKKCSVLEIPSSISLYGVQLPVTKFDNTARHSAPVDYSNQYFVYDEIKLPDSVLEVVLRYVRSKKINIPKHAKVSLQLDIDDTIVEIPMDHDYYRLKDNFVYDRKDLTKIHYVLGASGHVRIPEGVKYVGRLLQNSRIERLTLPSTLERIGTKFAYGTGALKAVNLSKTKLKEIPLWAFGETRSLKKVKLPSALLKIAPFAFCDSDLRKLVIPNKVTDIGGAAFSYCNHLKKVTIGKKVKRICASAFERNAISEITIPANVEKVDDAVFIGVKNLRKITFLHKKRMPRFKNGPRATGTFKDTHSGIKFYVKNRKMAKQLKKRLKNSKVEKAKIYAGKGKKLIYKNVNA